MVLHVLEREGGSPPPNRAPSSSKDAKGTEGCGPDGRVSGGNNKATLEKRGCDQVVDLLKSRDCRKEIKCFLQPVPLLFDKCLPKFCQVSNWLLNVFNVFAKKNSVIDRNNVNNKRIEDFFFNFFYVCYVLAFCISICKQK